MAKITRFCTLTFIMLIRIYRYAFSLLFGNCCRFSPTCSQFAINTLETQTFGKACLLILRRLCSCHPWHPGGLA